MRDINRNSHCSGLKQIILVIYGCRQTVIYWSPTARTWMGEIFFFSRRRPNEKMSRLRGFAYSSEHSVIYLRLLRGVINSVKKKWLKLSARKIRFLMCTVFPSQRNWIIRSIVWETLFCLKAFHWEKRIRRTGLGRSNRGHLFSEVPLSAAASGSVAKLSDYRGRRGIITWDPG